MPSFAGLEDTGAVSRGAGKRTFDVTEEIRHQEFFRDRGAIHGEERAISVSAIRMNFFREQLLAGTGFAQDHDRDLRGSQQLRPLEHFHDRSRLTDDAGTPISGGGLRLARSEEGNLFSAGPSPEGFNQDCQ